MINRNEFIEEQLLRENIRKAIRIVRKRKEKQALQEDQMLRSIVRKMLIMEKTAVADEIPHEKTGINYLKKTLKKVIPSIKDTFMSLTTSAEQRESYIAHLVNGIDNLLAPIEVNIEAPARAMGEGGLEEDVGVSIGGQEKDEPLFDAPEDVGLKPEDIGMKPEVPEEPEDEDLTKITTGMEEKGDEDEATGINAALGTFKQIQGSIVDDFGELANEEDRELYHDYIKTNILLWRDKFEDALAKNLPPPTTPEYEEERQHIAGEESVSMAITEASGDAMLDLSLLVS